MHNPYRNLPFSFTYSLVAVSLLSLVLIFQEYVRYSYQAPNYDFSWDFHTTMISSKFWLWALLTPLLWQLTKKLLQDHCAAKIVLHITISLVFAFLHRILLSNLLSGGFFIFGEGGFDPFSGHALQKTIIESFNSLLEYWLIMGVFLTLGYYRKYKTVSRIKNQDDCKPLQLDQETVKPSRYQQNRQILENGFSIKKNGRLLFIYTDEIYWIESSGNYVSLNLETKNLLYRSTMNTIEAALDEPQFIRIHRSYIINTLYIQRVRYLNNNKYEFILKNGRELISSRSYNHKIAASLHPELLP